GSELSTCVSLRAVVPEASLRETDHGLVPDGEGWFVVNAGDARWFENELGGYCGFEGQPRFSQLGINLNVLPPGKPMAMYHREGEQEDFLVLAGECVLVIDDEERPLNAWDFVHCPAGTDHVIVGAGDRPCLVLAVGAEDRGDALPGGLAARAVVGTHCSPSNRLLQSRIRRSVGTKA